MTMLRSGILSRAIHSTGITRNASSVLNAANKNQILFPSVQRLLKENNISQVDALNNIKASGNNGRILKGDVLAYLGKISNDSVTQITQYIKKYEHLDLEGIESRTLEVNKEMNKKEKIVESKYVEINRSFPFVIEKDDINEDIKFEDIQDRVDLYLNKLYSKAHKVGLGNGNSLFNDLVRIDANKPRFEMSYDVAPIEEVKIKNVNSDNIFDEIIGDTKKVGYEVVKKRDVEGENNEQEYILGLNLKVNTQYFDANERANLFLDKVAELRI